MSVYVFYEIAGEEAEEVGRVDTDKGRVIAGDKEELETVFLSAFIDFTDAAGIERAFGNGTYFWAEKQEKETKADSVTDLLLEAVDE